MNDFLEFLAKFEGGTSLSEEDVGKLVTKLRERVQPLYQAVFDTGHSEATKRHQTKVTELEDKVKEADSARKKAEKKLQEVPDVAKLEEQYRGEIATLTEKLETQSKGFTDERVNWHREQAQAKLAALLVKKGVDPDWADYLAKQPEQISRLRVTAKDGQAVTEVLKAGTEIPLQSEDPLDAFAGELRKGVKSKFIINGSDRGAGSDSGGETGAASLYDRIREDAKVRHEGQREGPSAADRMAVRK